LARSFIAARSSAEKEVELLADFCVSFIAGFLSARSDGSTLMIGSHCSGGFSAYRVASADPTKPEADLRVMLVEHLVRA
jgi:hypothetical protein